MKPDLKQISLDDIPELLEIPDRPKQMYMVGQMPPPHSRLLAVVGSRAHTIYGKQAVNYLIGGLRGYPIVIVSGLAYGIDTLAHRAALDNGLITVAVPGSGLDEPVLYPRGNISLAKEILKNSGALMSELPPTTPAADWTFPRRNRIMVGMSHAVLVVEAKEKSGSLITAKLAADYNKELLVVPGSIFSESSKGTHQFLKLGARACTEPNDILQALGLTERSKAVLRADISDGEKKVLNLLASPATRDELITRLEMTGSDANSLLSLMEIKGLIVEEYGAFRIA